MKKTIASDFIVTTDKAGIKAHQARRKNRNNHARKSSSPRAKILARRK